MATTTNHKIFKTTNILSDYEVNWDDILGQGSNGQVFTCKSKHDNKKYALKIIDPDEDLKEIELLTKCENSDFIVKLKDAYMCKLPITIDNSYSVTTEQYYLIMEMMDGGDLSSLIEISPIPEHLCAIIAKQIAFGIRDLHQQGIIHRDIKSDNILLSHHINEKLDSQQLIVKIADLGLAEEEAKRPNAALGMASPNAAPEIIANDYLTFPDLQGTHLEPYSNKVDIWSFGTLLYNLLTGYNLFSGYDAFKRIAKGEINFSEFRETNLSSQAQNLILQILQVDPAERPNIEMILQHPWFDLANQY